MKNHNQHPIIVDADETFDEKWDRTAREFDEQFEYMCTQAELRTQMVFDQAQEDFEAFWARITGR